MLWGPSGHTCKNRNKQQQQNQKEKTHKTNNTKQNEANSNNNSNNNKNNKTRKNNETTKSKTKQTTTTTTKPRRKKKRRNNNKKGGGGGGGGSLLLRQIPETITMETSLLNIIKNRSDRRQLRQVVLRSPKLIVETVVRAALSGKIAENNRDCPFLRDPTTTDADCHAQCVR